MKSDSDLVIQSKTLDQVKRKEKEKRKIKRMLKKMIKNLGVLVNQVAVEV